MLPSVLLIVVLIVDWLVLPMSAAAQEEEVIHGPVRRVIVKHKASAVIQTYNDARALVESVTRTFVDGDHPAEQAEEKVMYTYDLRGHRTADLFQDAHGETYPLRRYAYDAGGNKTAEAAYHMCGTFSSLHLYTYDEHHKLIEDVWYENRTISKKVYSYDGRGRLLKSTRTQNGALHALTHYRYDEHSRIVEELAYGPDDSLIGKFCGVTTRPGARSSMRH